MADLPLQDIVKAIVGAMRGTFAEQWPQVRDFAEGEAQKLGVSLAQITRLTLSGQISEGEASVMLEMQKNAARTVLLAIRGMGIIAVESAINSALAAVRDIVNRAIGFALL
ncbi:hypothetical protein ACMGDH_17565 [Sphingomonas sp. DT-207]|uniref:hypothetical protein n=1 Tax=Sphingomonas sp. DT-207 TaxID=3396167 RepID=UPI003F1B2F20